MSQAGPTETPAQQHYDVVIVGGAMYGASVSWFLCDNPDFDGSIRVVNMWVGRYAFNTFDQNAILGPHTKGENFIFVN